MDHTKSTNPSWPTATSGATGTSMSSSNNIASSSYPATSPNNPNWAMDYDTNNNSSSCTSNEPESAAGATRSKSLQTFGLDKAAAAGRMIPSNERPAVDMAELAKNIGNELRGAFIVLPQKSIFFDPSDLEGDDQSTNSEDCVYAYRGDHADGQEMHREMAVEGDALAVDIDDDDETDFLEMDFDPEPNSEQENFQRRAENGYSRRSEASIPDDDDIGNDIDDLVEREEALNEWRDRHDPAGSSSNRSPMKDVTTVEEHCIVDNIPLDKGSGGGGGPESLFPEEKQIVSENKISLNGDLDEQTGRDAEETNAPLETIQLVRVTGTKPKVKIPLVTDPPVALPTLTLPQVPAVPSTSNSVEKQREDVSACLECSELEFLTTTTVTSSSATHCKTHCKKVKNCDPETASPTKFVNQSQQIQIYPNILDEENIYSSLMLLGVKLHRDRLRHQIESSRLSIEQTKTIADYVIEYTKANCDSRRFIKIIEDSCPEEIFQELQFDFQPTTSEMELLHLDGGELLSRWSPEQSLRELSRITNAQFHAANVLGKVANLIRMNLKQKCREIDKVNSAVVVPTYYRPGLLMISKRGPEQEHQTRTL